MADKTKTFIFVEGDTNDADYVSKLTEVKGFNFGNQKITKDQLISLVKKIGKILKKQGGHNWEDDLDYDSDNDPKILYKGKLTEDEIEIFQEEFVPHGENGIHTISEIKILEVLKVTNVL